MNIIKKPKSYQNFLIPVLDTAGNTVMDENGHKLFFNQQLGEIVVLPEPEILHSEIPSAGQNEEGPDCESPKNSLDSGIENDRNDTTWSDNETLALITAYEKVKDNFCNAKKRKDVWIKIANELAILNVIRSAEQCERKWLNLIRTYKKIKDVSSKTGQGTPKKFKYYDRIDEIVGNKPSNKAPEHSNTLDIGIEKVDPKKLNMNGELVETGLDSSSDSADKGGSITHTSAVKRKSTVGNAQYFKFKQEYMKYKMEKAKEKEREKEEKREMERLRLSLEERKVLALEKIAEKYK